MRSRPSRRLTTERARRQAFTPQPGYLAEVYRKIAVRYVFMAEGRIEPGTPQGPGTGQIPGPRPDRLSLAKTKHMTAKIRVRSAMYRVRSAFRDQGGNRDPASDDEGNAPVSRQVGRPRIGAAPAVRSDELWLSKRLVQDRCEPHTGLAKLQRHILSGPGHIVV
jgi:hypothetical protein